MKDLTRSVDHSLSQDYKNELSLSRVTVAWSFLQVKHGTCGVDGFEDWAQSQWSREKNAAGENFSLVSVFGVPIF